MRWMPDWLGGGEAWAGVYEEQTRVRGKEAITVSQVVTDHGQGLELELRRRVDIFLCPKLPPRRHNGTEGLTHHGRRERQESWGREESERLQRSQRGYPVPPKPLLQPQPPECVDIKGYFLLILLIFLIKITI